MKNGLLFITSVSSAVRSLRFVMSLYYLLVGMAGILSGFIFWDMYEVMNPSPLVLPEVNSSVAPVRSIAVWNAWIDATTSTPPTKQKPAPKTVVKPKREIKLKINLIGIFGGRKNGVAIMSVDGQSHRVYGVGDVVKNDVKMSEVRLTSILVKADDIEKEYFLPEADLVIEKINNDNLPAASGLQPSVIPSAPAESNNQSSTNQQPIVQKFVPQVTPKVRKKIVSVKKQVQEKPLSALSLGNFQMTRSQGQLGIQVRSFKHKDVLLGLGLQLNDIIISVNGQSIQEITNNPQLVNSLLQQNSFDVVIIRNGRQRLVPITW